MGIQPVRDVDLIRHAYTAPARQGRGVGGALLSHLLAGRGARPLLVGTWAAAEWAIRFYERYGFVGVSVRAQDASCCGSTGRSRSGRSRRRWCWSWGGRGKRGERQGRLGGSGFDRRGSGCGPGVVTRGELLPRTDHTPAGRMERRGTRTHLLTSRR